MLRIAPHRLAHVAAETGFDFTGFRLTPSPSTGVDHQILGNDRALETLCRDVNQAGIEVLDVEVVRMTDASSVEQARPLIEAAQALSARFVIATVEDQEPRRRVETLFQLAELAKQHNTTVAVEFMLFSSAPDLQSCLELVKECGNARVVILADILHLERSGGTPHDLLGQSADLFPYAQICGAEGAGAASSSDTARTEGVQARLLPHVGDLPIRQFIRALPPETILSVEAPLLGQSDPSDPVTLAASMLASARKVVSEV